MIVLDASAVLELLLVTPVGVRVFNRAFSADNTLHAPELLDLEITQVLRRYVAAEELGPERAEQALTDLSDLAIRRYPHAPLLSRIWQLRHNLTAYDGAYAALAEALGATLLTCDARLAAAPGVRAEVEVM